MSATKAASRVEEPAHLLSDSSLVFVSFGFRSGMRHAQQAGQHRRRLEQQRRESPQQIWALLVGSADDATRHPLRRARFVFRPVRPAVHNSDPRRAAQRQCGDKATTMPPWR